MSKASALRYKASQITGLSLKTFQRHSKEFGLAELREIASICEEGKVVRPKELAVILGFSQAHIYKLIETGKLKAYRWFGHSLFIPLDQVILNEEA